MVVMLALNLLFEMRVNKNHIQNQAKEAVLEIEEILEKNPENYQESVSNLIMQHNCDVYIIDEKTGEITASTEEALLGKNIAELGLEDDKIQSYIFAKTGFYENVNAVSSFCYFEEFNGMHIGLIYKRSAIYKEIPSNMLFISMYLILIGAIMVAVISYHADNARKKEQESRMILEAVAGGFTSYMVIDWETEGILEHYVDDRRIRNLMERMAMCETFTEAITEVYRPYIAEEQRDEVLSQLDTDVIRASLEAGRIHEISYIRRTSAGDTHIQMFISSAGEVYGRKVFVVSTRNIDKVVEKEIRQQNELAEALEKANIANQAKTNFLFNMSHDIRTPMNAILGFANIAEKHVDDRERVLDSLGKIDSAGRHLLRLINNVLDMARIESGKTEFNILPHHIPTLMEQTETIFALEMKKKNIDFDVSWDIKTEVAYCDQLHIEQVELNLISNALKYTPEGGKVTYHVSEIECEQEGYVTYRALLKDSGIGMSEEFCQHVFEAYERERVWHKHNIQGTGLGLAITKTLIEQMGGTIVCRSELGVGTEFEFTLTLKAGTLDDLPKTTDSIIDEIDFAGKRVLLVEDNELNREIANEILTESGFEVETAEDGIIAVEKVSRSQPGYYDLVLMDIQMPNMNGYKATQAIRRLKNKELASVPIIAMTANAFEEDKTDALAAGMNEHIAKPIDIPKMMEVFKQIIK